LDARIARLRERLKNGDPNPAPDELLAAINRAIEKREELVAAQRPAGATADHARIFVAGFVTFDADIPLAAVREAATKSLVVL